MGNLKKKILIGVLTVFALLTLFLSSSVIFDLFGIREKEGNFVPIVVWANFIASILYLITVYGLIKDKKWVLKPLLISVGVLILAQVMFFIHIVNGHPYETKTIGAMIFRISITVLFTIFTFQLQAKQLKIKKNN